ncbi:MAG: M20/M25/M40 family metallo-hydrolase [Planctomycetota bacterium]|nr:MAG: M20/M25/M40 family metallo-hydrolase [Planctomycetota bacterium]
MSSVGNEASDRPYAPVRREWAARQAPRALPAGSGRTALPAARNRTTPLPSPGRADRPARPGRSVFCAGGLLTVLWAAAFLPSRVPAADLPSGAGIASPRAAGETTVPHATTQAWPVREAERSIRQRDLKADIFTLAADSLEGREAGTQGGWAAAAYIVKRLRQAKLAPAAEDGGFFQEFGHAYRNILAVVPGRDPRLRSEYVLVGAHYDHVGYGNERNSRGPIGYVHNGADDNASGTAALLEIAEALMLLPQRPRRSVLIAFWDAEEKGLLGSRFFVRSPTVPLERIRFVLNIDMVGRLRNRTVEVFGWRTGEDLRRLASASNRDGLTLRFPLTILPDSDHYPFFEHGIPYLLLHTGKHAEYHTPSDDAPLINLRGTETVARMLFRIVWEVANRDRTPDFRDAASAEARADRIRLQHPVRPQRLGISWNADRGAAGEFVLTAVGEDSPAERAGLQVGDRLIRFNGTVPRDSEHLIALVHTADPEATVTIRRDGASRTLHVRLAGTPDRVGVRIAIDPADNGGVVVTDVIPGGLADRLGVQRGDRLLLGEEDTDRPLAERARRFLARRHAALLLERDGRILSLANPERP